MSVRAAEQVARSIAQERVRKYHRKSPEMAEMEKSLTEQLGTRVIIEANEQGGRLMIDFFSPDDLTWLVSSLAHKTGSSETPRREEKNEEAKTTPIDPPVFPHTTQPAYGTIDKKGEDGDGPYSIKNFSV
jgi:hypothetical protein